MKNHYFVLFQDCIITDGAKRSIIFDVGQKNYIAIEKVHRNLFIQDSYFHCNNDNFTFAKNLEKINFGYFTNDVTKDKLNQRTYHYFNPKDFSNIVIDFDENLAFDIDLLINKLKYLNVDSIQVRCVEPCEDLLIKFLSCIEIFSFRSIELYIPSKDSNNSRDILKKISKISKKLTFVTFYNSTKNETYIFKGLRVIHNIQNIFEENQCGYISQSYFVPDIQFYSESQLHNNCLNKKIAIDIKGNVKNCPYSKEIFGNINELNLQELMLNEHFKKYWFLKKDDINICSDCEFRYICSDCRIFTVDNDLNGKPEKCKYDPYSNIWND